MRRPSGRAWPSCPQATRGSSAGRTDRRRRGPTSAQPPSTAGLALTPRNAATRTYGHRELRPDRHDHRPFRWARVPPTLGLIRQWAKGAYVAPSSETIYCAELVATTYQQMGLLAGTRPARRYDPGRFWSGDRIALVAPYALAAEIAVR